MRKLPIIFTILVLAALLLPTMSLAQEPVSCEVDYTVQVNDWLSKLADKYYGDLFAYPAIVAATNAQTDEAYASIEEAARAVAEKALAMTHEGPSKRGFKPRR